MKRLHLEALRPVCPYCRAVNGQVHPVSLAWVEEELDGDVITGALECSHADCRTEFPILDGLPILVPDPRTYVAENVFSLTMREDLSPALESRIGECCGPGSALDSLRIHLSSYGWDHYADLDPRAASPAADDGFHPEPGSVVRVLDRILGLVRPDGLREDGPTLEIGCSVGRIALELAGRTRGLVLGVDTNSTMLRLARRALVQGRVRFPLRRVGMIYDEIDFAATFPGAERVDFWIADAGALPFEDGTFGDVVGLNVIDSVASPLDVLRSTLRVLSVSGRAFFASPYDWSGTVTTPPAWIGGHSPRSDGAGASEAVLRALLTPGVHPASLPDVEVEAEAESIPWNVRMHARSVVRYSLHAVVARKKTRSDSER